MDMTLVKNFALNLRKQLIYGVGIKIKESGTNFLVEEISYMWFIRLIAIRFMQENKYINSNLKESTFNKTDFISLCNYLSEIMPTVFDKIDDKKYILLPDNMFGEESIVAYLVEGIEEVYWKIDLCEEESEIEDHGIEIIGWLYQYYFSEKKEEIFLELKKEKLTKDNIPTATQIFTPKWIVKYMVENSLGKLWFESSSNAKLLSKWNYFVKDVSEDTEEKKELKTLRSKILNPEEIKVLDPAMGSGHILAYAFDVLHDIYLSLNYEEEQIPFLILEKNLYGLDIDDRVSKLAIFTILMKARSKNPNILDCNPKLNLISIKESNGIAIEKLENLVDANKNILNNKDIKDDVQYLIDIFYNAKDYGALLNIKSIDFDRLEEVVKEIRKIPLEDATDVTDREVIFQKVDFLIKQGRIMSQKYDVVIANPPYSGLRRFNSTLKKFVEENYRDYKYDLFSVFMIRNMDFTRENGIAGFMTPNVWQFISSYEKLRKHIIDNYQLLSLIQLGEDGFKDASVSISTFVIRKCNCNIKSTFIKLNNKETNQPKMIENNISRDNNNKYYIDQNIFNHIPGSKFAFWLGYNTIKTFKKGKNLGDIGKPRQGMATSDNNRFLRCWYEVNIEDICFFNKDSNIGDYKWVPYNKGGGQRKWYGNNTFVINWDNNGYEVKEYAKSLYGNYSRTIKNENLYFKKGITYTFIGKDMAPRFSPEGFIFDVAGSMIFINEDNLYYILGLMASKLSKHYLEFLNPSLNIQVGDIKNIPILETSNRKLIDQINNLVIENICISKNDWDSFETSWDFKKHPMVNSRFKASTIKESYNQWDEYASNQFNRLKLNEEMLNSIFIDIYGINEELTPEMEDDEITIRKAKEEREIKSLISYAVGCIFGRYSLDIDGLIHAGGDFKEKFNFDNGKWYVNTKNGWLISSMEIVASNRISVTDTAYDDENIVNRFADFVEKVFGRETLEYNLDYIANIIDKKSKDTSREIIKRYFLKDFLRDHLQIYQNRPIYYGVDGNEIGSKFLSYIHRQEEINVDKIKDINLNNEIK